ncbi:hypothetical protein [Neobacillus mesonae]|uniref:hypothetical protein n=1 Tax=Neobacillus mesonae TaxID=1193713 RepID=UPI002E211CA9|nr:hypothetical protein [Neobacillus mesonae]
MTSKKEEILNCGLIMPISAIDGLSQEHWVDVKNILTEAVLSIDKYKFEVKIVSDANDIGVIQKRIVQNVYSSDIIICDVSGKNPNVMFELGMRLAFDKPTVIVKDDKTNYSFDTSVIEHIEYPRDLRFSSIVAFKEKLAMKVVATYEAAQRDPEHSTFLKNFGKFKVASLNETEVTADNMMLEMLSDIQQELNFIKRNTNKNSRIRKEKVMNHELERKIVECIFEYRYSNKIETDIKNLIGDEELYHFIEEKIDAPLHFESKTEFINSIEVLMKTL